ncbi:uncharacterized protein LAESUDRAFT_715002 [Laetiporus sulphureus 93-53]|uniref:Uncharacterized protein n=1 Tax=Laetiporus sulphureus 93-53 TaxID=1314785 RepID=A0A165DMB5_9APHY|nr:uncharacterized protein LAESUDRAFT_715002 [Laetiporus sulphureus 93-53]KZT05191.1 hypothetical protein LAESUDRAFT_715002 [Laetiporus sulphureus 93-53]
MPAHRHTKTISLPSSLAYLTHHKLCACQRCSADSKAGLQIAQTIQKHLQRDEEEDIEAKLASICDQQQFQAVQFESVAGSEGVEPEEMPHEDLDMLHSCLDAEDTVSPVASLDDEGDFAGNEESNASCAMLELLASEDDEVKDGLSDTTEDAPSDEEDAIDIHGIVLGQVVQVESSCYLSSLGTAMHCIPLPRVIMALLVQFALYFKTSIMSRITGAFIHLIQLFS